MKFNLYAYDTDSVQFFTRELYYYQIMPTKCFWRYFL